MKTIGVVFLILLAALPLKGLSAQNTVAVPNLIGLSVPRAAAELNKVGLRLGAQTAAQWTADSVQPVNRISGQAPAADTALTPGTSVDLTVLRSANVSLRYDDNDLTVINLTDTPISLAGLTFSAVEGNSASFAASRWTNMLQPRNCVQIWSISRTAPKDVDGCDSIQNWLATGNAGEHFWTTVNGVVRFSVMENGSQQTTCDAASLGSQDQPLHCDVFITGGSSTSEVTPYVYFAYTLNALAIINQSTDQWMPTAQTTIFNYNPQLTSAGQGVGVGDPGLYGNPSTVADITRLAPGQCVLFSSDDPNAVPPQLCDVIAHLALGSNVAFWLADFQVTGSSDDVRRQCPAAVQEKTIICILPH